MRQFIVVGSVFLEMVLIVFGIGFLKNYFSRMGVNEISSVPLSSPIAISPQEKSNSILWGAYTGMTVEEKRDFEDKVGMKSDMISTFVLWSHENNFPVELARDVKDNNQILIIYWESWEPKSGNLNDKRFSYDAIIGGEWDDYIEKFGQSIADSETQIILIPFVEVNGNWYPWSITKNNNTSEKHKLAYRKIHDMLSYIPNLKFGWAVNNGSTPDTKDNSIANLYPGDAYTDYVGVDGFNFGNPWEDFDQVFGKTLAILKTLNKPIMIFSMASADGEGKSAWIEDMGRQLLKHPEISGFVWFNEDKERDWRVWSDAESLSAFKEMINQDGRLYIHQ